MFTRSSSIAHGLFVMVAIASFVKAGDPRQRIQIGPEESVMTTDTTGDALHDVDVDFPHPKLEFDFEKGLSCEGATDLKKRGAGKKCNAKMKKTIRIGMTAYEVTTDVASDMEKMFHDLIPEKDGFLPTEEDMMALTDMDEMTVDEMEDGASKTVKFGGFFKLNWDCTVTFKKEGPLKLSKTVDCAAKAIEGMGKGPEDFEEDSDEKEFKLSD
jgi:hypothetical protein